MHPITNDELAKAAANLKRIEDYLVVRTEWRTDDEGKPALRAIEEGAVQITRTLDFYRDSHMIPIDPGDANLPQQMPSETFDSSRTAKLGDFMARLSGWFKDRAGSDLGPGTEHLVGSIYSSLVRILRAVESILGGSSARSRGADHHAVPSRSTSPTRPAPSPVAARASAAEATGLPNPPDARSDRLVLDNTAHPPLLHARQDELELTDDARQMVAAFLERNGITFAEHKLRRFHAEVRRCIERTPDGQVLVIKVGGVDGQRTPFFTYQPKVWFDSQ